MEDSNGFLKVWRMRITGAWWCLTRKNFLVTAGNRQGAGLVVYARPTDCCIEAAFRYSVDAKVQVAMTEQILQESTAAVDEANEVLKNAGK